MALDEKFLRCQTSLLQIPQCSVPADCRPGDSGASRDRVQRPDSRPHERSAGQDQGSRRQARGQQRASGKRQGAEDSREGAGEVWRRQAETEDHEEEGCEENRFEEDRKEEVTGLDVGRSYSAESVATANTSKTEAERVQQTADASATARDATT